MQAKRKNDPIRYEFDTRPDAGSAMRIAPDVHWLRMPLPFALNHINLWLLQGDDAWTIVDTGVDVGETRKVWDHIFTSLFDRLPVEQVVVTHMHPDHVGSAGQLCEKTGADLYMTREEYLLCRVLVADTGREVPIAGNDFYMGAGFTTEQLQQYEKMFGFFGKFVSPLPESYQRLNAGDVITLGASRWEVIVGRGHSPEHACLYCEEQNLLISGDQLLPTISSNVSVYPTEPFANPLHDWITSLTALRDAVPCDVLVLPAHGKPFRGAHGRLNDLIAEHVEGLDSLESFCAEPKRAVDVFQVLFKRKINDSNLIFATGEAIAHLNYLLKQDRLAVETDHQGVKWYLRTRD